MRNVNNLESYSTSIPDEMEFCFNFLRYSNYFPFLEIRYPYMKAGETARSIIVNFIQKWRR